MIKWKLPKNIKMNMDTGTGTVKNMNMDKAAEMDTVTDMDMEDVMELDMDTDAGRGHGHLNFAKVCIVVGWPDVYSGSLQWYESASKINWSLIASA